MKDLKNQHEDTKFSSSEHGKRVLKNFKQQPRVANRAEQTVTNYTRSIEGLMDILNELPERTPMRIKSLIFCMIKSWKPHSSATRHLSVYPDGIK